MEGIQIKESLFKLEIKKVRDKGDHYHITIIKEDLFNLHIEQIKIPKEDLRLMEKHNVKALLENKS